MAEAEPHLLVGKNGRGAWVVTLNRARKLNSLSLDMVRGMSTLLSEVAADVGGAAPACVVIKGACKPAPSAPAFCAGGDVRAVHDAVVVSLGGEDEGWLVKYKALEHGEAP